MLIVELLNQVLCTEQDEPMQTEICNSEIRLFVESISQKIDNLYARVKDYQERYGNYYVFDLDLVEDFCECVNAFENMRKTHF